MDDAFETMDAILDPEPLDLPFGHGVDQVGVVAALRSFLLQCQLGLESFSHMVVAITSALAESLKLCRYTCRVIGSALWRSSAGVYRWKRIC